ncbi:Cys-tRNA(Pro) deacylase [Sciscionella sediminilitoris]|uniref:Cys-tRNA(Pro) deacylase n=1 Tax=Sciscionella sediminilitoris TaxID=1445613 RepID=UPI0004DFC6B9|nr:Cys-tRNA(Pro) deacylase [Sciscionella sp. SE31]
MAGKATQATKVLDRARLHYALHGYTVEQDGESYGAEAAAALGIEPERMFKTLVAEVDGTLRIGVVPVSGKLDLKALAAAAGGKRARMAEVPDAQRATGYVAGGIAPLGHRQRIPVTVDESALVFPTIYCSAGRRGLSMELAPADLVHAAGANTAPIAG